MTTEAGRAWHDAHENGVVNPEQCPPMALAGQARQDRTDRAAENKHAREKSDEPGREHRKEKASKRGAGQLAH